jgi:DNA-binding CsgD family transcriptional regulator
MTRNFSIAFVILLSAFGLLFINRQRLKHQLKMKNAEAEVAVAKKQLQHFTQNLREKTQLLEDVRAQLQYKESTDEQIRIQNELARHTILTDADWDNFKSLFEKAYPGFLWSIRAKAPDITLAEQRMAALTRLQLSAREAASLLGISAHSVHKTRQRLRQRLHFEHDEELENYLAGI